MELGLDPVLLAARKQSNPIFAVTKPASPVSAVWFEYQYFAGLQLWAPVASHPIAGRHFPYDEDVEPDHP